MGNESSTPALAIMEGVETGIRETNRQAPRVLDSAGRKAEYLWDQHAPQAVKTMPGAAANAVINAVGSIPRKMEAQQRSFDRTVDRLPENTKRRADELVASIGPAANYCRQKTADVSNYAYESWDNLPEETKDTITESPERVFAFCYSIPKRTVKVIERIDACGLNPCYEPTMMGRRPKPRRSSKESFVQSLAEETQVNDPYRGFGSSSSVDHILSQLSNSRREDKSHQSQTYHSEAYKSGSSPGSGRHNTPDFEHNSSHSGGEHVSKGNTYGEGNSSRSGGSQAASQEDMSARDNNSYVSGVVSSKHPSRGGNNSYVSGGYASGAPSQRDNSNGSYVSGGYASGAPSQRDNYNGSYVSGGYASGSPSKGASNYYIGSSPRGGCGSGAASSARDINNGSYANGGFGSSPASERNMFSGDNNNSFVSDGLARGGGSSQGGPNSIFAPNNRYSKLSKISKSQSGTDHRTKLSSQLEESESNYSSSAGTRRVVDGGQFTEEDIFRMMKGGKNTDNGKHSGIQSMVFHQSNVTMNEPVIMGGRAPSDAFSNSQYSSM